MCTLNEKFVLFFATLTHITTLFKEQNVTFLACMLVDVLKLLLHPLRFQLFGVFYTILVPIFRCQRVSRKQEGGDRVMKNNKNELMK